MLRPPLLEAVGVTKHYANRGAGPPAVDQVSLRVERGETLGLVGESGCGKSTLGRCLLRLQTLSGGTVRFDGKDISTASMRALRPLRPRMQMIFQDPYGALNPRRQVGDLVAEPLRVHRTAEGHVRSRAGIAQRVAELVEMVGLARAQMTRYPHELSGGQRQRIGIARALALDPELIIADEPVSALDVSVQAQIVNLLMDLQDRLHLTTLFIAHDLAVVRQIATRTAVMYCGVIVETGPTLEVFAAPAHPYTRLLLSSIPGRSRHLAGVSATRAPGYVTPGYEATSDRTNGGCRFRLRCCKAQPLCAVQAPPILPLTPDRAVACHFPC